MKIFNWEIIVRYIPSTDKECLKIARQSGRVAGIKYYRSKTGASLSDAIAHVETLLGRKANNK